MDISGHQMPGHIREQNDLLSSAQEGFRPNRNTTRQLQRLIMAMEDHGHHRQLPVHHICGLCERLWNVDHARMAEILRVQGYPQDIIEIVLDLYTQW